MWEILMGPDSVMYPSLSQPLWTLEQFVTISWAHMYGYYGDQDSKCDWQSSYSHMELGLGVLFPRKEAC